MPRTLDREVLIPLVLAVVTLAGPVAPRVVLVTATGDGRTAAVSSGADYDDLARLVALDGRPGRLDDPGGHGGVPPVRVTWLIRDTTPWRVDRVFVHDDGTVWIATQENAGGGALWAITPIWHRGDPELATLLDRVLPDDEERPLTVLGMSPLLAAGLGVGLGVGLLGVVLAVVRRRNRWADDGPDDGDDGPLVGERLTWP